MAKVILLVGPPASGKSTWREKFLKTQEDEFVIISSDDLVDAWAAERDMTYNEAIKVAPSFDKTVKYAFKDAVTAGKNIIVDRTNMSAKTRRTWTSNLPEGYETHAVVFVIDDVERKRRMEERFQAIGKSVPEFVVKGMMNRYQSPSDEEGFASITYVRP